MQSLLQTTSLCIPLDFALAQIDCLDVQATLQKLKALRNDLLKLEVDSSEKMGIQITDSLFVTSQDMLDVFSGDYGDIVTSKGVALVQQMFNECYLEFSRPPVNPFPNSLLDYIASDVNERSGIELRKTTESRVTDLHESQFTYASLFYLFESMNGMREGKTRLNISNKSVTRSTIKCNEKPGQYETVFIWENEACRTTYLTREGRL